MNQPPDLTNFGITNPLRTIESGTMAMGDVRYQLLAEHGKHGPRRFLLVLDGIPARRDPVAAIVELLDEHLGVTIIAWLTPTEQQPSKQLSTAEADQDFVQVVDRQQPNGRLLLHVRLNFPESSYHD
jgi:hypothetical protein